VFEAGNTTPGIRGATVAAGDAGNMACYQLTIADNWFGDASGAAYWVKDLSAQANSPIMIIGNFFGDSSGTHVSIADNSTVLMEGNRFSGGTAFGGAAMPSCFVTMIGNFFNAVTTIFQTGLSAPRPASVTMLGNAAVYNPGTPQSELNTPYNTVQGRIAVGSSGISPNFPGEAQRAGPANDTEQLVLGAHNAGALVAYGGKAAVYTYVANEGPNRLAVQAAGERDDAEVQLVAGIVPTAVLRVSKDKLGFYGTAPIVKPAAVADATDAASAITQLNALLARLRSLGLIST